jgi:hypothetical protein
VSKGFLIYAENKEGADYLQQAYALALSIKYSQAEIKSVSLITNDKVPDEYCTVFDNIIPILWYNDAGTEFSAEHRWKTYHASPYDETIVLDADMLLLEDISTWWDYCGNFDLKFCSKITNYKLEPILTDLINRKTFIENNLPSPYYALHYFKKTDFAHDFFKVLEFVINNWKYCRDTFAPNTPQQWISMDLATAIAIKISGVEDAVIDSTNPMKFVHMKPAIQGWASTPISWRNFVNYSLNNKGEFVVGNIKQGKLFHYIENDFINSSILKRLKVLANG